MEEGNSKRCPVTTKLFCLFAFAAVTALGASGCAADTDEDEPVSESEDHLLAGRRLSESEIAQHVRNAGFPESMVGKMVCTAKYESSFYERASNRNSNGSIDRGLFQINSIHLGGTRGCPTSANALWDASTNAKCAYAIYKMQGINAWYGYRKHRSECDSYQVRGGSAAPNPGGSDDGNQTDDDAGPGGCWSGTLAEMVEAKTCVESKFDGVWFQCMNGKWYRGVSGNNGPYGACTSVHPL